MCGRFTLTQTQSEVLADSFGLREVPNDLSPRFNIAPTQHVAVVVEEDGQRQLDAFRWGLIPHWAKDMKIGNKMINARAETVAEKPSFRGPFKKQRCLILSDGFYEWQKTDRGKVPHYIHMANRTPFAMAGLWATWQSPSGETIPSCTIITTTPNQLMAPLHKRMPVILPANAYETWLSPDEHNKASLQALLTPYPAELMAHYPVSRLVNSPANDSPACIQAQ